jgi:hypothetical protein
MNIPAIEQALRTDSNRGMRITWASAATRFVATLFVRTKHSDEPLERGFGPTAVKALEELDRIVAEKYMNPEKEPTA